MTTTPMALTVVYWVVLVFFGLTLVISGLVLGLRRQVYPLIHPNVNARSWAVTNVLFSIFVLTNVIPRLAHAPDLVILVLSLVAFAPLFGAVVTSLRANQRPGTSRRTGHR